MAFLGSGFAVESPSELKDLAMQIWKRTSLEHVRLHVSSLMNFGSYGTGNQTGLNEGAILCSFKTFKYIKEFEKQRHPHVLALLRVIPVSLFRYSNLAIKNSLGLKQMEQVLMRTRFFHFWRSKERIWSRTNLF